jgi:hypothetical protein
MQGGTVRHDFSVLGKLVVTGLVDLGVADTAGTDRTLQVFGSETDIGLNLLTKGTGVLKVRVGYAADVSANEDLINLEYFNTHISTSQTSSLLQAPTITEDNYSIVWDNTLGQFTLKDAAASLVFQNALTKVGNTITFEGALIKNTNVTGNFDLYFGTNGDKLSVFASRAVNVDIRGNSTNRLTLTSNSSFLYGGSTESYFSINDIGRLLVGDLTASPRGLTGVADYSANVTDLDYVQKVYADNRLASRNLDPAMLNPGPSNNNRVVRWDNGNNRYTLSPIGSLALSFTWNVITANTTAVGNTGYITDLGTQIEILLSTDYLNQIIRVANKGLGGWKIVCDVGKTILFVDEVITDSVESTLLTDSIELLCVAPNTWKVINSVGNITFTN